MDAGQDWSFLHQTFIDYCAAKSFVESGANLTATILSGDQGLLARPQLLQTLAYLRGSQTHRDEYLRQLQALFTEPELREHLRVLLFGWFGALRNPDDNEWRLTLRVLRRPEHREQLLGWMGANPVWFARVRGTLLPTWMETEDEFLEQVVMSYLRSLGGVLQKEVATLLAPFVGRSSAWDQRIFVWISNVREWKSKQAVDLFEKVMASRINDALSRNQKFSIGHIWSLQNLIEYDLLAGCRVLVRLLDGLLAVHRAHPSEPRYPDLQTSSNYVSTISLTERLDELNSSAIRELLDKLPKEAPQAFLDEILPWIEEAFRPDGSEPEDELYHCYNYRHDGLYDLWHGGGRCVRHLIAQSIASALVQIARSDKVSFNATVARIASWECLTPHQILVNTFQSAPELLADEAAQYLLDDRRRFDIGDRKAFDSRRLISLICPHLDQSRRDELHNFIVFCSQDVQRWRGHQDHLLKYRGSDELLLLEAFPAENRNASTRATIRELRAKFPDLEASKSPTVFGKSRFPEPLTLERALKISDRAWIRLFQSLGKTPPPNPTRDQEQRLRGLSGALVNQ